MSSKIKNIIILVIVAVALVLIYFFFLKKEPVEPLISSSEDSLPVAGITSDSNANLEISGDFISMLLSVKGIRLEDAIFRDQAFASLIDSSISLVQLGDEGRPNPFAPIGSESNTPTPLPELTPPDLTPPVAGLEE